jgi:uncharacterized protein (DUF2062 family)
VIVAPERRGPFARLHDRAKHLAGTVLREHATPARLGVAVGLGALVGSSPLVGLHAIVALALASCLRLNRAAAFAGSNVSFGPLLPLLIATEVALGAALLRVAPPSPADFTLRVAVTDAARTWWLGWLVLGLALALLLGGATYVAARMRQDRVSERPDPPANG